MWPCSAIPHRDDLPKTDLNHRPEWKPVYQHQRPIPAISSQSGPQYSRMTQRDQPDPILLEPYELPQPHQRVLEKGHSASLGRGRDTCELDVVSLDMPDEGHKPGCKEGVSDRLSISQRTSRQGRRKKDDAHLFQSFSLEDC
jgi:hypothetical protein